MGERTNNPDAAAVRIAVRRARAELIELHVRTDSIRFLLDRLAELVDRPGSDPQEAQPARARP